MSAAGCDADSSAPALAIVSRDDVGLGYALP